MFWEDLELKADSLVLHGQMEAGWLYSGGRTRGLGVALDETEFSAANGMASADLRNMSDPSLSDVRGIAVVKSKSFEELGPEELAKLSYQTPPVSIPAAAKLPGVILGVRTAYSRYAKVRVDQSHDKALYLRWITYDRQPDPFGEIVGQLAEQHGTEPEDTKAWGTFSAKVHGLYSAYGLKTSWTYDGPGQVHFTGASIQITIDFATDLPPSVDFNPALQAYGIGKVLTAEGRLKVTVVDIFGRSVSAEKTISCTSSKDGAGGMDVLMPPLASQWELKKWLLSPDPVATQLRTEIATQELLKFLK